MKKLLLLLFVVISATTTFSQTLDPSFDGDGKVVTPIVAGLNSIYDIALQPDGKIVAVGFALTGVNYDIAVARYDSDGGIDSTFNLVGFDIIDMGFNTDVAYGVAIQTDGKIVVSGSASNASNTDFILIRYNSDGTLDNSFDSDGMVITTFDVSYETAYDVAIQSDGKIVAAGSAFIDTSYNFAVARYNTDGSLDAGFGTGGKSNTLLTNNDEAKAMVIQADGKIVLAGSTMQPDFSYGFGVVRYNSDGTLDNTFDSDGKVITTSISPNNDFAQAIAVQADGKLIVAGKATPVGPEQFAVVRYNTNGSLDLTWNSTGMVTTAFGSTWDEARTLLIKPNGKIVAGGLATISGQKFAMACYNTDGTLDAAFGAGGKITTSFGSSASIWALALQPDAKIIAAGYSGSASNYDFAMARYSDGKTSGIENMGIVDNSLVAYPNPFNNNITLEYNLQSSEMVTIQLVDIHGKVQETYLSGQTQASGSHQQNLIVSEGLPTASYFIIISTPNGKASIKVSKQ